MNDLINYLYNYGGKSFVEEPFNEVDNVILCWLTYLDLKGIVGRKKIKLSNVIGDYLEHNSEEELLKMTTHSKYTLKFIRALPLTKRFKDLRLYNYIYIADKDIQFSALEIEITSKLMFVAFEGTDNLLSGWQEDFELSYEFPIPSQRMAIRYLNRTIGILPKSVIVGGHSKGGNLAMVSAMMCHNYIARKIIRVYNNDGPGLLQKEFNSKYYARIENKLVHIIPQNSIVGLLMHHGESYEVIKSSIRGIYAHDLMKWEVSDNHFIPATLTKKSKEFDNYLDVWLSKYSETEREKFVTDLFGVFKTLGIKSLDDIREDKKKLIDVILTSKKMSKESKKMTRDILKFILYYGIIN
jgi:hypothetical protein